MRAIAAVILAGIALVFMLVSTYVYLRLFTDIGGGGAWGGWLAAIVLVIGWGAMIISLIFYGIAYVVGRGVKNTVLSYEFKGGGLLAAINGFSWLLPMVTRGVSYSGPLSEVLVFILLVASYFAVGYLLYRAGGRF